MNKKIYLAGPAALVALVALAWPAGRVARPAAAQTTAQAGAGAPGKRRILDLTQILRGKTFADGTHLVKTLDTGEKVSIVVTKNRVTEIVIAGAGGRLQKNRLKPVARSFTGGCDLPDPQPGSHYECDNDCAEVGPEHETVCTQVPDAPGEPPGEPGVGEPKPPSITRFVPATGRAGAEVRIEGRNLVGVSEVKFNGVGAKFTARAGQLIFAAVPGGATTGPITVTAAGGTTESKTKFKVRR